MSNIKTRLQQLEKKAGLGDRMKYMCVIDNLTHWDTPEERAKGYKIQPCAKWAGGTGGEPFYLASWEDVEKFESRPDVELLIIEFGTKPASEAAQDEPSLIVT
jgi:hypothetical protein